MSDNSVQYQEVVMDNMIYITILILIVTFLGTSVAYQKYIIAFEMFLKIYICFFLIWRFNPFREKYVFTSLDRKIAFNAGVIILTNYVIININIIIKTIYNIFSIF